MINLPPTNSEVLVDIKKDIEALHHDLHEVRNAVRWLPELLDILEIDGRTLADILTEITEHRKAVESGAAVVDSGPRIVIHPKRVNMGPPVRLSSSKKTGTRRASSGRSRGGGGRSHRKR